MDFLLCDSWSGLLGEFELDYLEFDFVNFEIVDPLCLFDWPVRFTAQLSRKPPD